MNPNNDQLQNEDDNSLKKGRIRRDPTRGRSAMPEPDNVVPSVAASPPIFRAMAMQNKGPQLVVPTSHKGAAKSAPLVGPHKTTIEAIIEEMMGCHPPPMEERPAVRQLMDKAFLHKKWNISKNHVQKLPMYFPRNMIQWEFSFQDLPEVLERISEQLRNLSIQASFTNDPLSAKLQTCHENAELYLVFFNNPNGAVSMSLQRHKGDHVVANRCIRRLVDAAKGTISEDNDGSKPMTKDAAITASAVLAMERLIERCAAESSASKTDGQGIVYENDQCHPFLNQTPEQMTESVVRDVHGWLKQRRRLDLRRQALEYLLAMTDLKRTLRTTAIATSLIVLQGKIPTPVSPELNSQAHMIQSILLNVLLRRELPGDRAVLAEGATTDRRKSDSTSNDMDLEMRPYFPEVDNNVTAAAADLPQYYTEFMNELFNLALQILVQSLEVAACFPESLSSTGNNIAIQTLDGKDLYHTLLGCVGHAESKLANGYLACKALRLLASDHPGIKNQIKSDDNAKESIRYAYQVGRLRHTLLEEESFQLLRTVRQ